MKRCICKPVEKGGESSEKLIAMLLERVGNAGYAEMVLDTREPFQAAIHLYKKFGFSECEPYYDNLMDDVIYEEGFKRTRRVSVGIDFIWNSRYDIDKVLYRIAS